MNKFGTVPPPTHIGLKHKASMVLPSCTTASHNHKVYYFFKEDQFLCKKDINIKALIVR